VTTDWTVREYVDGDGPKIVALFERIFGKARDHAHWEWEFLQGPGGSRILIAEGAGAVVGHLAGIRRRGRFAGEEVRCALEVDGMVHPDWGRRGIFVKLGRELLSRMGSEEGVGLVLGFPNRNALPGHRKMSCVEVGELPLAVRPVNVRRVVGKFVKQAAVRAIAAVPAKLLLRTVKRVRRPSRLRDFSIEEVGDFDDRFDRFWNEIASRSTIILNRDREYLSWRYGGVRRPDYTRLVAERDGRVLGLAVTRVIDMFDLSNGMIVELISVPGEEHAVEWLLVEAMNRLEAAAVDLMAASLPVGSDGHRALMRCGFLSAPDRLKPRPEPFIVYVTADRIDRTVVADPANWYITWGDTDVV
jgi:hypothetical protein